MAKPLLDDDLWNEIEPLLPTPKPRRVRFPGRQPIDHRQALTGILFVLKTGIGWEDLPQEMGCGSGMTCWRRMRDWQQAGVWERLHRTFLEWLSLTDQIDWSRASIDSGSVPAPGGRKNRPESNGSPKIGLEAPSCGRKTRNPTRHKAYSCQCERDDHAGNDGGCDPCYSSEAWPTKKTSSEAAR